MPAATNNTEEFLRVSLVIGDFERNEENRFEPVGVYGVVSLYLDYGDDEEEAVKHFRRAYRDILKKVGSSEK